MRAVTQLRDERQRAAQNHPFFAWLRSSSVPLERRLDFAPAASLFVLQFRDMNMWALPYEQPRNEYEWVITSGTHEDRTHSRMFIADWRSLGLDERLGWQASDTLWWMFVSPGLQEVIRHAGMRFLSLAVADQGNPFVRYAHSEAGEATGHVFLSNSAPIAAALSGIIGRELRYFGPHHLALESGHVANTEGLFEELVLGTGDRQAALQACNAMFDVFDAIFNAWLDYARLYVERGRTPARPEPAGHHDGVPPAPFDLAPFCDDPRTARVAWTLNARRARAAAHPLYSWLRACDNVPARERLCALVPQWAMDILGYRDLTRYALSYDNPQSEPEHLINSWASELSTHSGLFLGDWDSLGLDKELGFTASDTMQYLFLDPDQDLHRQHLIEFAKLALRHRDPALRWWLMAALEATGESFFACTRPLAEAVERETGLRLDYLTERHCPGEEASRACPALPPELLRPEDESIAVDLVNTVFDAMELNLTRSYAAVRARLYSRTAA